MLGACGGITVQTLDAFLQPGMGDRLPEPANAIEKGMADLQQRLFPLRLAHGRQELNRALARYVDAGVQELANSRAGRVPNLIEYAQFRREIFAAYTAPYPVELSMAQGSLSRSGTARPSALCSTPSWTTWGWRTTSPPVSARMPPIWRPEDATSSAPAWV